MLNLTKISQIILLEQDSKLTTLKKSITERIPISIRYSGPYDEVLSGDRYDIEPVVLGKNAHSGNLVIWAYVFKGVSKKGLPGWKMFRVDRIKNIKLNTSIKPFELDNLPGYVKGKAPNSMRSLIDVEVFSPYWYENDPQFNSKLPEKPEVIQKPETPEEPKQPELTTPEQPEITIDKEKIKQLGIEVYNELVKNVEEKDGEKFVSFNDYNNAINNLYKKREGDWKNYQRQLQGNVRPGEGTRERISSESKKEIDYLLKINKIKVKDFETISEIYNRFIQLIK